MTKHDVERDKALKHLRKLHEYFMPTESIKEVAGPSIDFIAEVLGLGSESIDRQSEIIGETSMVQPLVEMLFYLVPNEMQLVIDESRNRVLDADEYELLIIKAITERVPGGLITSDHIDALTHAWVRVVSGRTKVRRIVAQCLADAVRDNDMQLVLAYSRVHEIVNQRP